MAFCFPVFRVFPHTRTQGQPFPVPLWLWRVMHAERDLKFETKGRDLFVSLAALRCRTSRNRWLCKRKLLL